jgi:transcriptional regulator with XRE-family HTH domain
MDDSDEIASAINELKAFREANKISQAQLARNLGVSPARLSQWMLGDVKPNLRAWLRIKEFLRKNRSRK